MFLVVARLGMHACKGCSFGRGRGLGVRALSKPWKYERLLVWRDNPLVTPCMREHKRNHFLDKANTLPKGPIMVAKFDWMPSDTSLLSVLSADQVKTELYIWEEAPKVGNVALARVGGLVCGFSTAPGRRCSCRLRPRAFRTRDGAEDFPLFVVRVFIAAR